MYSSKYFNSRYMEFVGYYTCDKLIWKSGEGRRIKNIISKQVSPKTHINNISPTSTLTFFCPPHKYTSDIFSDDMVSSKVQKYSSKQVGIVL